MTDTKGNGIMHHIFMDYEPYKGDIPTRQRGSLVAFEDGETTVYGLYNAQERGTLFVGPGVKVYQGMVVGENLRGDDMDINVCKKKHMTNMRSSTADEALRLVPYREMSLEQCMEFIGDDELIEVTPKNIRMRKRVLKKEYRAKQRATANR
jgi:GTP-binding protein